MALVLKDRVRETTTVLGTNDATLLGAVTGYQSFSVIGNANTCYYTISDNAGNWEVGIGTYSSAGPTLARTTIISSSTGSKVSFPAGTKDIFVTYPAEYATYVDGTSIVPGTSATLPTNYGGTGLSSFTAGGAVYATSTSALATGTLPTTAGGTGLASYTAGDLPYYSTGTALSKLTIGASGYVLKSNGTAPVWDVVSNVAVTTFSAGTTGLTPSTATAGAVTLAGTLVAANGGTGQSSYAVGDLLYASSTTALSKLADVATGNALISGGVSTAPSWGKIGLTTHVSGTLPIANGGTNSTATPINGGVAYGTGTAFAFNSAGTSGQILQSNGAAAPTWVNLSTLGVSTISFGTTGLTPATATSGAVTVAGTLAIANGGTGATVANAALNNLQGYTTTATAAGTTTLTSSSSYKQYFTGTTTQTVAMPDVTTLALGRSYEIINNSTGLITVNSSGGNAITTIPAGLSGVVTCIAITGTTAASWHYEYASFDTITGTGACVFSASPTLTGTLTAAAITASADSSFTSTGALTISKGTTAQQPGSPVTGMMRYNSTTNQFEGYSGATPAWKSIGGSALSNDTATSSNLYPVFAAATTGTAENLYTSNAKYLYKPSTGELQASQMVASNGIFVNSQTVSANYTIPVGSSAMSAGPVTVASGVTVTVSSGSRWVIQ